jgi:hypothetical protein
MILVTKEESWNYRETFLLCLAGPVSPGTLLRRAKVRADSYAGDLISQLHKGIFVQSLELKTDYATYFTREYQTFGNYLSRLFKFDDGVIRALQDVYKTCEVIYRYRPNLYFLEGAYGREFLAKLIEPASKRGGQ